MVTVRQFLSAVMLTAILKTSSACNVSFQGFCYEITTTREATWDNAKAYCEAAGGQLASITSREENMFLTDRLDPKFYWIGMTYRDTNTWNVWLDGSAFTFAAWDVAQPSTGGFISTLCATIYGVSGVWQAGGCASLRPFICKTVKVDGQAFNIWLSVLKNNQ
ncbi:C-type lectin lectoxin-Lio3-like [Anneissia japonica]|uniref:C-type lectin lectoxin-Lio3-like n=1 Tax=Anneissia japonica TaxID=1529436 RepID=UPI0014255D88|nr:C-type lectin lectoxin-Lio3-like [Anneissia japonica]